MNKIKIKLLAPHTHAGRMYQAGDEIEVGEADAEFICGLNVGENVNTDKSEKQIRGEQ